MKIKISYNKLSNLFHQLVLSLKKIVKYKDTLEFGKKNIMWFYIINWNQSSTNFILMEDELYKDDINI